MFETSVVRAGALAAQRRTGLVTVSIAAHAAVVVGAITMSIASIDFPRSVPRQMTMFRGVSAPPPLGTPDGGKPQQPKPPTPQPKPTIVPPVTQVTAPATIPTTTPTLEPSTNSGPATDTPGTGGNSNGPLGQPWGDPNSDGPIDQGPVVASSAPVTPAVLQPGVGDVKPAHVLRRVDPIYPNIMRAARMSATVRIHCIIGSDGRVRDPQIVVSSYPPFNNAVLQALNQWTFAPGTLRGQAVDTYFDLTVTFSVK